MCSTVHMTLLYVFIIEDLAACMHTSLCFVFLNLVLLFQYMFMLCSFTIWLLYNIYLFIITVCDYHNTGAETVINQY